MSGGDATIVPDGDLAKQAWTALLQMRGIRDGHNVMAGATKSSYVTAYDCMLLNMHAELSSLTGLYGRSQATELLRMQLGTQSDASLLQMSSTLKGARSSSSLRGGTAVMAQDGQTEGGQPSQKDKDWALWTAHKPRGTAFVRRVGPKGGPDDLLSGHVTFANYGEALRVMKHYHLNFDTLVTDISMSSYPGCISSTDDYFVTNRGFALMSTTLYIPSSGNFSI
eukprot:6399041-Amphidinium_carterae.1